MRISPISELALVLLLSVLLVIIIVALPSNPLRVVLGLPYILLFPGYTLVVALFPGKDDLGGVERLALSLGLSIAAIPLIGLILNYTPWGIGLYPILVAILVFIVVASVIASYRRHQLPADERFSLRFNVNLHEWTALRGWDRALGVVLIVLTMGAIGTVAYAAAVPGAGEGFTEFYILGPGGMAEGYPERLALGEKGMVILGIVNNEHENDLEYRVEILIDGEINETVGPLELDHEQQWEEEVSFTPATAGDGKQVEFLLYQQDDTDPSGSLHFRIDVAGLPD